LTTDPTRHRLLLVHQGDQATVTALSTTGKVLVTASLGFPKGDVAVTGSTIWVAGFGQEGAVLRTLDPETLRGSGNLQPAPQLGPGAVIAASGQSSIWLRSGGQNSDVLWCRNVAGNAVDIWTAPGHIAPAPGVVFVADVQQPLRAMRIIGDGCAI
ncbi:MAG TPA: hypothetical protein VJ831_08850, partial [Jatrophihabitantaceae bacterium]|nr:hypothetical protein [Jatrophihabitantaceae bacterium]